MAQEASATGEFIRKDVFDARMDRMEMLLEKTLTEIKAEIVRLEAKIEKETAAIRSEMKENNAAIRNEMKAETAAIRSEMKENNAALRNEMKAETAAIRSEMKENNARLETKIEVLTTRVDALHTWQYWQLTWVSIFIAVLALVPLVVRYVQRKVGGAAGRARILLDHIIDKSPRQR